MKPTEHMKHNKMEGVCQEEARYFSKKINTKFAADSRRHTQTKADKKWEKKAGQSCLILSIHLTEHTEITEFFQDIFLTKAMLSPMNPGALQAHLSNILG